MKPKNRVFCVNAGRLKMKFNTEKEANTFIKFNSDDIPNHRQPLRAYYCECCMGWHISKCYDKQVYHDTDGLQIHEIRVFSRQMRRQSFV